MCLTEVWKRRIQCRGWSDKSKAQVFHHIAKNRTISESVVLLQFNSEFLSLLYQIENITFCMNCCYCLDAP